MIDYEQIARDAYREVFHEGHTLEAHKPIEAALIQVAEQARRDAAVEACNLLEPMWKGVVLKNRLMEHFDLSEEDFTAGPAPAECPITS